MEGESRSKHFLTFISSPVPLFCRVPHMFSPHQWSHPLLPLRALPSGLFPLALCRSPLPQTSILPCCLSPLQRLGISPSLCVLGTALCLQRLPGRHSFSALAPPPIPAVTLLPASCLAVATTTHYILLSQRKHLLGCREFIHSSKHNGKKQFDV